MKKLLLFSDFIFSDKFVKVVCQQLNIIKNKDDWKIFKVYIKVFYLNCYKSHCFSLKLFILSFDLKN